MSDTYTCFLCKETFEKGWSDEEAADELKETFNVPVEQTEIVCDDCYHKIMGGGKKQ